jgi:acylphosphatase
MTDMIFYIEGETEDIFNKGFRPALMGTAAELGLKSAASNIRDKTKPRVQVLASGSYDVITSFHQYIKDNDIRVKKTKGHYEVGDLEEYSGPNIDWSGYQMSAMFEQMYKGFNEANERLSSIEYMLNPKNKSSDPTK